MAWKEPYQTRTGAKKYRVVYRDGAGKKHSKSFDRSKDADAYMLDCNRREQLGHLYEDAPQAFGEFAGLTINDKGRVVLTGDGWFERYKTSVRTSTFDRRVDVIRHLKELLPLRMDRITPALVEDQVTTIRRKHPRQARFLHDTIKMILRAASVRGQRVDPNVLLLKAPSYGTQRVRKALTQPEVEQLAAQSDEPHLVRVAAYTGLRQGELFALRDADVDLDNGRITVSGTVYDGVRYEHTKTEAGRRVVDVAPQVVSEIRKQMMRRSTNARSIIFPSPRGHYHRPQHFNVSFKAWVEAAGLDITFHDLRHTYASLMVKAGTHPKVLQEMMGHRSFTVTMELYTHLQDEQRKSAATVLGEMLAKGA